MPTPSPALVVENGFDSHHVLLLGHTNCTWHFNIGLHQLWLCDEAGVSQKIDLGFAGTRLLERLVQNPGEVVSREELIAVAWPERVVGQGSLNQLIYTLRQLLGDEKQRSIIQTLPRRGYLFNPAHQQIKVQHLAPVASAETPQPSSKNLPSESKKSKPWLWSAALLAPLALASALVPAALQSWINPSPAHLEVNQLDIWLLTSQDRQRKQLLDDSQALIERLPTLTNQAQQILISQQDDYYHLHCNQGANSKSLTLHQSELQQVSDQQLLSCLSH